jgi:hypothetical protein
MNQLSLTSNVTPTPPIGGPMPIAQYTNHLQRDTAIAQQTPLAMVADILLPPFTRTTMMMIHNESAVYSNMLANFYTALQPS